MNPLGRFLPSETRFFRSSEPKAVGAGSTNSPGGSSVKMVSGAIPISICWFQVWCIPPTGVTGMVMNLGYTLHPKGWCPILTGCHFQAGTSAAPLKGHSVIYQASIFPSTWQGWWTPWQCAHCFTLFAIKSRGPIRCHVNLTLCKHSHNHHADALQAGEAKSMPITCQCWSR